MEGKGLAVVFFSAERRLPPWARRVWPAYLLFALVLAACLASMFQFWSWMAGDIARGPPRVAPLASPPGPESALSRVVKVEGGQRKVYRAFERGGEIQVEVSETGPAQ